jgi:hypothetical protein
MKRETQFKERFQNGICIIRLIRVEVSVLFGAWQIGDTSFWGKE